MNQDEQYIDRNIAELSREYSLIHGSNINLARITPQLIDGLKMVAKRLLYIMYLRDSSNAYRKVAAITGEVIATVHHHGQCLRGNTQFVVVGDKKIFGDRYIATIEELFITSQAIPDFNVSIIAYDAKYKGAVTATARDFRITKHVDELYRVQLTTGAVIECTGNHPFLIDGIDYLDPVSHNDVSNIDNSWADNSYAEFPATTYWLPAEGLKPGHQLHREVDSLDMPTGFTWRHDDPAKFPILVHDYDSSASSDDTRAIVASVEKIMLSDPEPVYDFTVDDYENAMIYVQGYGEGHYVFAHNSSVYSTLVNLAQGWNNNIPLIDGYGNYGTPAGDPAGADRYIQARISEYAKACFFEDWKEAAVDMVLGADEKTMEPVYLPAKYPNALLNGILGIGYGMSSNVPPYCFKEVVDVVIDLMKDPDAKFLIIPDSPTGCDIIASNFQKICETGIGSYSMRCKYEIDADNNSITIIALPYQVTVDKIVDRIAEIKEAGGLAELDNMENYSGSEIKLKLTIRHDISPYKFMRKLIGMIPGLERSYPVNITVTDDLTAYDLSIRQLLLEWIQYRREQKRVVVNGTRTRILGDQRTNDVKIFILSGDRLDETIKLFRAAANRAEIERKLIERYHTSDIRLDSLQAKALSGMRLYELCEDTYLECLAKREVLAKELAEIEAILAAKNGIDLVIVGELKDGVKRFGADRRSNVIPSIISIETDIQGESILQLSADGIVYRRAASNAEEEPLPKEPGGFAVKVENDASFVAIDEFGLFSFINVKEIPVESEVPLNRFIKLKLGKIAALIPFDIDSNRYCSLISAKGIMKRFNVSELKPSKRPCIDLDKDDKLIKGIVSKPGTHRDILVFTRDGFGQRLDPNLIRVTSYNAKGVPGFKLSGDDLIVGCYLIDPRNQYLLYITTRGKARLNLTEYLPLRDNRNATMVRLIQLPDRDQLLNVVGCDKFDKLRLFYQDLSEETIKVQDIPEGTMNSTPVKIVSSPMVSNRIVKVSLI